MERYTFVTSTQHRGDRLHPPDTKSLGLPPHRLFKSGDFSYEAYANGGIYIYINMLLYLLSQ